jgi:uncharacterized UBP type Zn finger protein
MKVGDEWVYLRLCLTCGHVGYCDSSKNKYATKHFCQTTHPTIKSFEPGEDWGYCYEDELSFSTLSQRVSRSDESEARPAPSVKRCK